MESNIGNRDLVLQINGSSNKGGQHSILDGYGYDVIDPMIDVIVWGEGVRRGNERDVNTSNVEKLHGKSSGHNVKITDDSEDTPTAKSSRINSRRRSTMNAGGQRKSIYGIGGEKPKKERNTYQLEPYPGGFFSVIKAKLVTEATIRLFQPDPTEWYNPTKAAQLIKTLSNAIIKRVKCFEIPRYKFVVHTVAIQKRNTNALMASKQLVYADFDRHYHATKEFKGWVLVVSLYGLYTE